VRSDAEDILDQFADQDGFDSTVDEIDEDVTDDKSIGDTKL
jgi:hypothetical protein